MASQQFISLAPSVPTVGTASGGGRAPGPVDTATQQPGKGGDICVGVEADVTFIVGKQYAFVRVLLFLF